ncbi:MAG: hypothetical protein MUF06_22465 [Pirellulaceae bacterium]|jgi:hypothetical protein|nr:hypothetical protein [Pirellulaceae bacterium]
MTSSTAWCILTKRYGEDVRNPTEQQLEEAARELFTESLPGMTQGDYKEHGTAFLRCGFDEGPLYVIEGSRSGLAALSKYADPDFEELVSEINIEVSEATLLELWKWLAKADIDAIGAARPESGW